MISQEHAPGPHDYHYLCALSNSNGEHGRHNFPAVLKMEQQVRVYIKRSVLLYLSSCRRKMISVIFCQTLGYYWLLAMKCIMCMLLRLFQQVKQKLAFVFVPTFFESMHFLIFDLSGFLNFTFSKHISNLFFKIHLNCVNETGFFEWLTSHFVNETGFFRRATISQSLSLFRSIHFLSPIFDNFQIIRFVEVLEIDGANTCLGCGCTTPNTSLEQEVPISVVLLLIFPLMKF